MRSSSSALSASSERINALKLLRPWEKMKWSEKQPQKGPETYSEFGIVFGSKSVMVRESNALSMSKLLPARKEKEGEEGGMVMEERTIRVRREWGNWREERTMMRRKLLWIAVEKRERYKVTAPFLCTSWFKTVRRNGYSIVSQKMFLKIWYQMVFVKKGWVWYRLEGRMVLTRDD